MKNTINTRKMSYNDSAKSGLTSSENLTRLNRELTRKRQLWAWLMATPSDVFPGNKEEALLQIGAEMEAIEWSIRELELNEINESI